MVITSKSITITFVKCDLSHLTHHFKHYLIELSLLFNILMKWNKIPISIFSFSFSFLIHYSYPFFFSISNSFISLKLIKFLLKKIYIIWWGVLGKLEFNHEHPPRFQTKIELLQEGCLMKPTNLTNFSFERNLIHWIWKPYLYQIKNTLSAQSNHPTPPPPLRKKNSCNLQPHHYHWDQTTIRP